jgi:hypothetical protein
MTKPSQSRSSVLREASRYVPASRLRLAPVTLVSDSAFARASALLVDLVAASTSRPVWKRNIQTFRSFSQTMHGPLSQSKTSPAPSMSLLKAGNVHCRPEHSLIKVLRGAALSLLPHKASVVSTSSTKHYGVSAWSVKSTKLDAGQPAQSWRDGTTRVETVSHPHLQFNQRGLDLAFFLFPPNMVD